MLYVVQKPLQASVSELCDSAPHLHLIGSFHFGPSLQQIVIFLDSLAVDDSQYLTPSQSINRLNLALAPAMLAK